MIKRVLVFKNDMVAVFDEYGKQMPEYQGPRAEVWEKIRSVYNGPIHMDVDWSRWTGEHGLPW